MCTVNASDPRALICDAALPFVRSALTGGTDLVIEYRNSPGDGTEVRLTTGDQTTFVQRVRAGVARANSSET